MVGLEGDVRARRTRDDVLAVGGEAQTGLEGDELNRLRGRIVGRRLREGARVMHARAVRVAPRGRMKGLGSCPCW